MQSDLSPAGRGEERHRASTYASVLREQSARLIGPRRIDLRSVNLRRIAPVVVILLALRIVHAAIAGWRRIAGLVRRAVGRIDIAVIGLRLRRDLTLLRR